MGALDPLAASTAVARELACLLSSGKQLKRAGSVNQHRRAPPGKALLSSIMSDDPTLFIEGRALFSMREAVPDDPYFIRLGEALVRREGEDVSLVTMGSMVPVSLQAADALSESGISVEVVDLRCLMPLDLPRVLASVKKTGRLVVAEPGWRAYGAGAEIVAAVAETLGQMRSRPRRVAWPQSAVPTARKLEEQFYPTSEDIQKACRASVTEN
jgi:pyruvate/2-oxoglutarate/acetoin dehydrogenase E1 component